MLSLIKYELLRRKKTLIIALVGLVLLEGVILFSLYKGGGWIALAFFLLFLMVFGTIVVIVIDAIRNYAIDLHQKAGYMLFLTPNSGHKIIISKLLTTLFILLLAFALLIAFVYIDYRYFIHLYYDTFDVGITQLVEIYTEIYGQAIPSLFYIIFILFEMSIEFFGFIVTVMFSMTIRKTILSNVKLGGLITFVIFLGVLSILGTLNFLVSAVTGVFSEYIALINEMVITDAFDASEFGRLITAFVLIGLTMNSLYIVVFTYISGRLLNRRVDL